MNWNFRADDCLARLICGKGADRLRRIRSGDSPAREGWPSGLRRTPGKRVGVKAPPGFESPSLRHLLTSVHIQGSHDRGFLSETAMPDMPDPLAILLSLDRQAGFLITLEPGSLR